MTTLTAMPASMVQGDTLSMLMTLGDYDASTWTLTYTLVKDAKQITFSGSDDGSGNHEFSILPTTTTDWSAGTYHYQGRVSDGTDTHTVDTGSIEIKASFADHTSGLDARSSTKQILDALEATIQGKASKDQLSYSIAGRSISRMSMSEILEAYDYFKREYQRIVSEDKIAAGMGTGRKILTRFTN